MIRNVENDLQEGKGRWESNGLVLKVKMTKFKTYILWRKEREQNKENMRNKRWMETQKEKPNHKKKD